MPTFRCSKQKDRIESSRTNSRLLWLLTKLLIVCSISVREIQCCWKVLKLRFLCLFFQNVAYIFEVTKVQDHSVRHRFIAVIHIHTHVSDIVYLITVKVGNAASTHLALIRDATVAVARKLTKCAAPPTKGD